MKYPSILFKHIAKASMTIAHFKALPKRLQSSYSISDGLDVLAGANLFLGDSGRFGQYDKNDMVFMKLKYSF